MYRQLASAQLRERLYKTGYRGTKASPKEVHIGTTSQNTAITVGCGVSAVATGTPVQPVPGTTQLKTPPRLVRLVTVPKAPVVMQTVAVASPNSPVPQTPIINAKQPSNTTATAPVQKAAIAVKRRGRPKGSACGHLSNVIYNRGSK